MNMKKLATLVSAVALSATVSANAMAKEPSRWLSLP